MASWFFFFVILGPNENDSREEFKLSLPRSACNSPSTFYDLRSRRVLERFESRQILITLGTLEEFCIFVYSCSRLASRSHPNSLIDSHAVLNSLNSSQLLYLKGAVSRGFGIISKAPKCF